MKPILPSLYFTGASNVDDLSSAELEKQIALNPFDASLRFLSALKSGDVHQGQSMLYSRDRLFLAHMMEGNLYMDSGGSVSNEISEPQVLLKVHAGLGDDKINTDSENLNEVGKLTENEIENAGVDAKTKKQKAEKKNHKKKSKGKNDKKSFKLREFGGISPFAQWLIAFKVDDLEKRLKKEAKKEKKRLLEENARKSVKRSSSTISEPLAVILKNQGHFEEAKKMYGQLMQKFPEKSSYFAAKIEEINKQK